MVSLDGSNDEESESMVNNPLRKTPTSEATPRTAVYSQTTATPSPGTNHLLDHSLDDDSWEPVRTTTASLVSKLEDLQWQSESLSLSVHEHDFDLLSFSNSPDAVVATTTNGVIVPPPTSTGDTSPSKRQGFTVVGGPGSHVANSRRRQRQPYRQEGNTVGESVFDRLYSHAKAKAKAESARAKQQSSPSHYSSLGGTTLSSRSMLPAKSSGDGSPVFERLYQLSKKPNVYKTRTVQPLSATESLERRLNYEPPVSVNISPRHQTEASVSGAASTIRSTRKTGGASLATAASTRKFRTIKPLSATESLERRLNYKPPDNVNISPRHRSGASVSGAASASHSTRKTGAASVTTAVSTRKSRALEPLSATESLERRLNHKPPDNVNISPRHQSRSLSSTAALLAAKKTPPKTTTQKNSLASVSTQKTRTVKTMSASESLQRRLNYTPPNQKPRRRPFIAVGGSAPNTLPLVHERLHRNEVRPKPIPGRHATPSAFTFDNVTPTGNHDVLVQREEPCGKAALRVHTDWHETDTRDEGMDRQHVAVYRIQARWRAFRLQRQHGGTIMCAQIIQAAYRDHRIRCERASRSRRVTAESSGGYASDTSCDSISIDLDVAALCLQAWWRMASTSCTYQSIRICVVVIQAVCRGHLSRSYRLQPAASTEKICWTKLQTLAAATSIQSWLRMIQSRRATREKLRSMFDLLPSIWRTYADLSSIKELRQLAAIILQAHVRTAHFRKLFSKKITAVIMLQALVRGILARSALSQSRHESIVKGQAAVRGTLDRIRFSRVVSACIKIQYLYRKHQRFTESQHATLCIQTLWRVASVHSTYLERRNSALLVQTAVRGWLTLRLYDIMRVSCIRVQSIFRGKRTRRQTSVSHNAVICIQKYWRGASFRSNHAHIQMSVLLFQAAARRWLVLSHLSVQRSACIRIQSAYRGHRDKLQLMYMHLAAVCMQKYCRGAKCRSDYVQCRSSVPMVQAVVRGWSTRRAYFGTRSACIQIQSAARGHQARLQTISLDDAAVCIQKCARGVLCRSTYDRHRVSASMIQAAFRGCIERRCYAEKHSACLGIQRVLRGRKARLQTISIDNTATCIQKQARGMLYRLSFAQHQVSASLIQAVLRGSLERRRYLETRIGCCRIQRVLRGRKARLQTALLQEGAIIIQKYARGTLYRSRYVRHRVSASIIQATFRGSLERRRYLDTRTACLRIQRAERSRRAKMRTISVQKAAIIIQKHARGTLFCLSLAQHQVSASMIQAAFRGSLERRRYLDTRIACLRIQRAERNRQAKLRTISVQKVAIIIQKYARGALYRSRYVRHRVSASIIQAVFRGSLERRRYLETRTACLRIQRAERNRRAKMRTISVQKAAITRTISSHEAAIIIQKYARGTFYRSMYVRHRVSASMIQAALRGSLERRRYFGVRTACCRIQRVLRGGRKAMLKTILLQEAATCIQRYWRRAQNRVNYSESRVSIQMIQAVDRRKHVTLLYLDTQSVALTRAAACVQRYCRGVQCRVNYENSRALILMMQAAMRGKIARARCLKMRRACRRIQALTRGRGARLQATAVTGGIVRIQSFWRATRCHILYSDQRAAALMIQTMIRGEQKRRNFKSTSSACIRIQSWTRYHQTRRHFVASHTAAVCIQRYWRGNTNRTLYCLYRESIRLLQAVIRGKTFRVMYLARRCACIRIQSITRGYRERLRVTALRAAAVCIQKYWRGATMRSSFTLSDTSVILLQSFLRGCQARVEARIKRKTQNSSHRAVVRLQAFCRLIFCRREYEHQRVAAKKIQKTFFVWKMELTLLKLESSVVLLQRITKGDLGRSATLFALLQINSALQSRSLASFSRIVFASDTTNAVSLAYAWDLTMTKAMEYTCIVIQRKFRRYRSLMPLVLRQNARLIKTRAAVLIQLTFRCFSLRKEIATVSATTLQRWWRANRRRSSFIRSPVAVKLISQVDRKRALIVLCPTTYSRYHRAACVIQASTREMICRRQVRKSQLQERESVRLVTRLEKSANDRIARLLNGEAYALRGQGPCIERLADRIQLLQSRQVSFSSASAWGTPQQEQERTLPDPDSMLLLSDAKPCLVTGEKSPLGALGEAVFGNSGMDSLLSPIKPMTDGWNRLE